MKKILFLLFVISSSAHAQVKTYDYIFFCDKMMENVHNSVGCLQQLYTDLKAFKKNPESKMRYFDSYNCTRQPDQKFYDRIKSGPSSPFKSADTELWNIYNECWAKNGEIIAYLRLEDYKTDLEKGFTLIREMQQLQIAMGKAHDQIATRIAADSKTLPASRYSKPYQQFMKVILHEEDLILKLSRNFDAESFVGFPKEEVLKSFLETDDLLKNLNLASFNIPDRSYLQDCIEGLKRIQETKQHALDAFNNTSTLDGRYANQLYENLQNYFNSDILRSFAEFCAQGGLNYYPVAVTKYTFDLPLATWPLTHLNYSPLLLDSLTIAKQPAPLPTEGFNTLNNISLYIDECVLSMADLFNELRSEESTWSNLRRGKMPYKNPSIKFEKFAVPVSIRGLVIKDSKHLPVPYRKVLIDRLNDLEEIMLAMQDHLIELSRYMSTGAFRGQSIEFIDTKLKTIETLYTELDLRKEKLFMQTRSVYAAFPPKKANSWTVTSSALLKATDDSRSILKQMERKIYEGNKSPVSIAAIHEDQRDLIINELKYMKGIVVMGSNNGLSPDIPYEYIPGYLKTLEEKVLDPIAIGLEADMGDKNEAYGDFLYMHNIIIEQYNKFSELALNDDDHATYDPLRPVYFLMYIHQPPKFHYEIPTPDEKKLEEVKEPEQKTVLPTENISFEGYAFNNLILLLDVSASMDKPDRLPLLKKSLQQLIRLMRKEDEVSIVIYSGKATLQLAPVSASDTTKIISSIQDLRSEGKTNIMDGLELAYKTAEKNFIENGNNKIIMATDGEFNTGETLYKLVEKNSSRIVLSVFDFSQRPEPLKPIQKLAEKGNGNYVKVTVENSLQVLATETRKEKK